MSPDAEHSILEALKAGQTYQQVVDAGLASSKSRVAAVARKHGFQPPPRPPRLPPPRPRNTGTERNAEQNGTPEPPPAPPRERVDVQAKLDRNSQAAGSAVTAAARMIAWAGEQFPVDADGKIISRGGPDIPARRLAAEVLRNATDTLTRSNSMLRLNAGLPTSFEKGEHKNEGTVNVNLTAEQVREQAGKVFGYDLGRTASDPLPMAADVRSGSQPS